MRLFLWFAMAACVSEVAIAQFNSGIQGLVTDSSGAVVPEATIHVTNTSTGVSRNAVTSAEGLYRIVSLGPGSYVASAEARGFRTSSRPTIELSTNETVRVDFALQIGDVSETVAVVDRPPEVETEQGRFSGLIARQELNDLPINGRNIYGLLGLQPGITGRVFRFGGGVDANAPFGGGSQLNIHASGGRADSNSMTVDDASVNGTADGGVAKLTPNADSVEEVRVVSNNFSAVDGRNSGAQVQVITKGGSNQFHGGAVEDFQNNTLSSRNIFEAAPPVFRRNQFGYNLGGPILKNRLFFFTSYEGLRGSGGRGQVGTVETRAFRDFVVATRPNSIAAKLLAEFQPAVYANFNLRDLGSPAPGPNSIGAPDGILDVGSAQFVPATTRNGNQFSGRIDYELRPGKDRLFGNYYNVHSTYLSGGIRPAFDRPEFDPTLFLSLNHTHIFSPTKINEFKFGLNRGLGLPLKPDHLEVPTINITGLTGGFGAASLYPAGWFQTEFAYKDVFSWVRSSHSFKIGGEFRRIWSNSRNSSNYVPLYTFGSILNFANDEPLSVLRKVDPTTGSPATNVFGMRDSEWALFLNDDWKVTKNLTINYGLRYENFGSPTEINDLLRNIVYGQGSTFEQRLSNASVNFVNQLYKTNDFDFAPRLGFAWNPGGGGRTAIRGGFGLYFDRLYHTPVLNSRNNPPYRADATLGFFFGTPFTYSLGDPSAPNLGFPVDPALRLGLDPHNGIVGARVSLGAIVDPNLRQPYSENWFLGIQREISHRIVVEVNYLGSAGHHLLNITDVNRFNGDLLSGKFHGYNSSFAAMPLTESSSNSIFHGGTVQARRPFAGGFSLHGAFTFGRAIDDNDHYGGTTPYLDANNRKLDRGPAGFDVARRLSIVGLWAIPFFQNQHQFSGRVLGGWELAGTAILESGSPLTILTSAAYPRGDFNADGSNTDRPNAPPASVPRSGFSRSDYLTGMFPASVFPLPALGTDGNLGPGVFRGPGFAQVDLSLSKKFAITEALSLQLRFDAYNAFNRVNLDPPVVDLASSSFGRSLSQQTPRAYQIGARIRF